MKLLALVRQHQVKIASLLFVLLFFIVYSAPSIFVYVYPGQAGLLFRGLAAEPFPDRVYREGLYLVAPWNKLYIYDVTKQKSTFAVDALTNNGLLVSLDVSAIFHPDPEDLKELATHIGPDYTDKILEPVIRSSIRRVIGNYTPEDLYTEARESLHATVLGEAQKEVTGLPFVIEDVIVEKLELPATIRAAIEKKLQYQQDALAYQYLLAKQADESKRMKIEADGIKAYQGIVASNLNADLLHWLRIKALYDLAKSDNSKVIVIGDPEKMPLVLDGTGSR
jgi:regulator of protease activity HflC (stomatin/prohibitin superfamily)